MDKDDWKRMMKALYCCFWALAFLLGGPVVIAFVFGLVQFLWKV